jgi:hypothetical protein
MGVLAKSYLPNGYNYILEAININSWGNREILFGKLETMFPDNSSLMFSQSAAVNFKTKLGLLPKK